MANQESVNSDTVKTESVETDAQTENPKYLTEDAGRKQFSAFEKKAIKEASKLIDSRFEAFTSTLEEKLSALTSTKPAEVSKEDPEKLEMRKQLKALMDEQKTTQAREQERAAKERAFNLRSTLSEQLANHKIPANQIKKAVGWLVDTEKAVSYSEDGEIKFKLNNDEYDLSDALPRWLKTDDGKSFLGASGATGSGDARRIGQSTDASASADNIKQNYFEGLKRLGQG